MKINKSSLVALVGVALSLPLNAAEVNDVLNVSGKKVEAARVSQKKIDGMADQTQDMFSQYRQTSKVVDDLKVYNRKLEIQIQGQNDRLTSLQKAIADVQVIQRQITPLVERMIDSLEEFVALDVPFHMDERQKRIAFLRESLDRSDLSTAEKFRQVLEAYKIENEYGRKIDSYPAKIEVAGTERNVNMFRVGRIALLYQTSDLEHAGMWDQSSRSWVALDPAEYREAVRKGIRIANKQASINILELPIAMTEAK